MSDHQPLYFTNVMGEVSGPFTKSQVKELAGNGRLLPDSLVRKGEDGDWVSADRIAGLVFGTRKQLEMALKQVERPSPKARPAAVSRSRATGSGEICITCGSIGQAVTRTKGSFLIEVALWLGFCLPGIIYSIWRLTSREKVCRHCDGKMISLNSPRGKQLWKQFHDEE